MLYNYHITSKGLPDILFTADGSVCNGSSPPDNRATMTNPAALSAIPITDQGDSQGTFVSTHSLFSKTYNMYVCMYLKCIQV